MLHGVFKNHFMIIVLKASYCIPYIIMIIDEYIFYINISHRNRNKPFPLLTYLTLHKIKGTRNHGVLAIVIGHNGLEGLL